MRGLTRSLHRTRAGDVSCQFGHARPPASVSFVGRRQPHQFALQDLNDVLNPYAAAALAESLARKPLWPSSRLILIELSLTVVVLLGTAFLLSSDSKSYDQRIGMWVNPFVTCVAIYFWRYRIVQLASWQLRLSMFVLLIALTLPLIYRTGALVADFARIPLSKWLGDPLWIYTVPTASFFLFDLKTAARSQRAMLIASCVELFVAIPAWTVCCLYWQLYLKWFQLG